jgi:hypothetical protein
MGHCVKAELRQFKGFAAVLIVLHATYGLGQSFGKGQV